MLIRTFYSQLVLPGLVTLLLFCIVPCDGSQEPTPSYAATYAGSKQISRVVLRTTDVKPPHNPLNVTSNLNTGRETEKPQGEQDNKVLVSEESRPKSNETLTEKDHEELPRASFPKFNPAALLRGFYVFAGLGAVVIMYILVRTIRLRRKKTTVRKYGILANHEDVEMKPLEDDDEDDETTLFDMTNHNNT